MERARGTALALALQKTTDLSRRDRDHEPARLVGQQVLGTVVETVC